MVPKITALQEALPKSIGLLSFDGGIAGNKLVGGNQSSVSQWDWAPVLAFSFLQHLPTKYSRRFTIIYILD
jgi:hypothetical protein